MANGKWEMASGKWQVANLGALRAECKASQQVNLSIKTTGLR